MDEVEAVAQAISEARTGNTLSYRHFVPEAQAAIAALDAARGDPVARLIAHMKTIEPDEETAGCPATWADFIQILEGIAALDAARGDPVARVVEWLRKENGLCDCHARCETECGCGAWDDWKTKPLLQIADAIERGDPFNG